MEEIKSGYYAALYLMALLNSKIKRRRAELELQKFYLDQIRMEKEIEFIVGEYFDCTNSDRET